MKLSGKNYPATLHGIMPVSGLMVMFFLVNDVISRWAILMKTVLVRSGMDQCIEASAKKHLHGKGWHPWVIIVIVDFVVMLAII